ncbi:hypothetical protein BX600DRAFT_89492 [Xylariales sp. PMI_506]|nr:hypothetical protein BX600DRAFT_89492 [Xylariales sp. PMI_506]
MTAAHPAKMQPAVAVQSLSVRSIVQLLNGRAGWLAGWLDRRRGQVPHLRGRNRGVILKLVASSGGKRRSSLPGNEGRPPSMGAFTPSKRFKKPNRGGGCGEKKVLEPKNTQALWVWKSSISTWSAL